MDKAQTRADVLEQMTDGFITLDEGCERYLRHGGNVAGFVQFATKNKSEIFHGDPVSAQKEPWPKDLFAHCLAIEARAGQQRRRHGQGR